MDLCGIPPVPVCWKETMRALVGCVNDPVTHQAGSGAAAATNASLGLFVLLSEATCRTSSKAIQSLVSLRQFEGIQVVTAGNLKPELQVLQVEGIAIQFNEVRV